MKRERNIWTVVGQEYTSSASSINARKPASTFNHPKFDTGPGTVNADIGGGKFDNATDLLAKRGVENIIIDPFNRTPSFNTVGICRVQDGQADSVTVNNVLNVVKETICRRRVVAQAANAVKPGGKAFFLIYEGDKTGVGRNTKADTWQENRRTATYIPEIEEFFGVVERHGNLITARNAKP